MPVQQDITQFWFFPMRLLVSELSELFLHIHLGKDSQVASRATFPFFFLTMSAEKGGSVFLNIGNTVCALYYILNAPHSIDGTKSPDITVLTSSKPSDIPFMHPSIICAAVA